ncbi:MAG: hypothetical protein ACYS8W_11255 [Planctomycetota bacterium]
MFRGSINNSQFSRFGRIMLGSLIVCGSILIVLIILFVLWAFYQQLFQVLLTAVLFILTMLGIIKLVKWLRLKKARRFVQADPVNPEAHFRLAWAYYTQHVAGPSTRDRLEALSAYRNAIQLDLYLDIRKPDGSIRKLSRAYGRPRGKEEFIALLSYLAAIDYNFEEFERRNPEEIIRDFRGRRQDLLAMPLYELNDKAETLSRIVRDLALAYREQAPEPWLESLTPSPGDPTYTARRTLGILLDFHEEILNLLRDLIRTLDRIG